MRGVFQNFINRAVSELPFFEHCTFGKATRVKFSRSVHISSSILEYIHSDLWGPARVPTLGGARYFSSIIDDYSRKLWVFTLKHKSDVFKTFEQWKTLLENQTGKRIQIIRTDNGLEYLNENFRNMCNQAGIKIHLTVPHTPQQNGLAERYKRTILERVRCMLSNAMLPKMFWGEAVNTTAYLINKSPSTALNMKTPQEVWTGKPPNLSYLKTFGCVAYAYDKQDTLEPRARKCIFIGYPKGTKGYRLWLLESNGGRCIVRRDVKFDETDMPWRNSGCLNYKNKDNNLSSFEIELDTSEAQNSETTSQKQNLQPITDSDLQNIEISEHTIDPPSQT